MLLLSVAVAAVVPVSLLPVLLLYLLPKTKK
jgi:hypothetical protein